ncbi:PQQ-dependent dehydrogenase, methanol/ethanol family [Beijerinckia sp. L45]|uniref:PQQ-dependent dehydrogenase, methanol/ethanol family n=1 Tax=Beijerinckia sp. L45 TaxID=1641855 RepID=UPI001FED906F|nr:PQQ-dependent dehydrogenase, methanol/ethanol family [Beijerinckia sp. L45]
MTDQTTRSQTRTSAQALLRAMVGGASLLTLLAVTTTTTSAADSGVTQQTLEAADANTADWLTYGRNLSAHRFSPLAQINRDTVKNLKVAYTLHLGGVEGGGIWTHGGLEATPIVKDGFMYVTDGWGSVYKLDLHGGHAELAWKMDPKTDHDWAGAVACCGVDNRGVALWHDQVISHALDGRLIATNAADGKVAWQRQIANPDKSESITGAPLVINDIAISGVAGGEYGIRGWIAATDLNTHKEIWRTYTIPAKGEPGSETWKDNYNAMATGGGATWVTGTYDPKTETLFWGVGNPGPDWDRQFRPGDNLYSDSVLALDVKTGKIKWHYQYMPNDAFDYDGVSEPVLVDVETKGAKRHVMMAAERNGFAYALDRDTGKFIWGEQFVDKQSWTKGLDPVTGKPLEYDPTKEIQPYLPEGTPSREAGNKIVCPGSMGGKNWPPSAYNPTLKLWYIPVIESCNRITTTEAPKNPKLKPGEGFTGGGPSDPVRITGSVAAIDVTTGKLVAKERTPFPSLGGVLATPDLVFNSEPDGKLVALDAKTLKPLWQFDTGAGLNAPPITFSVDGKQYVAVLAGLGGAWDKWYIDGTPELKKIQPGSSLYVFSLN